jgi:hypothetical protein
MVMDKYAYYVHLQSYNNHEATMATTVTPNAYELYMACQARDIAGVKELLKQGADPNGDFHGMPGDKLLHHYQVQSAGKEILDLLIDAGAELEARDGNDLTPLMRAVLDLNSSALRYFIDKGASLEATYGPRGRTALDMCSTRPEQEKIIKDTFRQRAGAEAKKKADIAARHKTAVTRQEALKNRRPKVIFQP